MKYDPKAISPDKVLVERIKFMVSRGWDAQQMIDNLAGTDQITEAHAQRLERMMGLRP
jgi:hypothetical protein